MKKRAMNIIMIIMLVASFIPPVPAKAAVSREIRVGLTSMYSQKNEIRINNTKISLGYLSGRTFSPEANFNSALGFVFKPATEYYIDLGIDVTSYAAVLKRMAELPTLGIRIFGAVTGRGEWHIYAGGFADRQEAEAAVKSLNENGTECALLPGNSYRVKL
ncbi:MAG: SPOR domain-containing protein, partial [Lachnospiraceae bacterium]|nr:SPOR domain-containing protein [Lachnospiraceae bacterium]